MLRAVGIFCEHCAQNACLRALRAAGFPQIVTQRCTDRVTSAKLFHQHDVAAALI